MPVPAKKPPPIGVPAHGRRANADRKDDESIYNIGARDALPPIAPKIKVYHAAPVSPTGPPGARPRNHVDSSQISNVINPVHGVRDAQARQGIKPVNHAKSNVMAIKEASHFNALRKASAADQEKLQGDRPSYSRTNSNPSGRNPGSMQQQYKDQDEDDPNHRNFLLENKLGAGAPQRPGRQSSLKDDGAKYLQKADYGRVPSYLLDRKLQLAEQAEAAVRAKEAALIPAGMRLLPEEERVETLSILERNRQDVERALQTLPIVIETPSAIRRKEELERRLREIEDAFKIFSRPKVMVHI